MITLTRGTWRSVVEISTDRDDVTVRSKNTGQELLRMTPAAAEEMSEILVSTANWIRSKHR